MKIESIWDFIEAYYPDYDSCDEIAHNNDLFKLIEEEQQDGDSADLLLQREYGGDIGHGMIEIDHEMSLAKILRKAIEGWINTQNT